MAINCLFLLIGFQGSPEHECRYPSCRCSKLRGMDPCNILERPITEHSYLPFHVVSHPVLLHTLVIAASISLYHFMQRCFWCEEEESFAQIQISVTGLFPKSLTPFLETSPQHLIFVYLHCSNLGLLCNLHHCLLGMRIWLLEIHRVCPIGA